MKEIDQSMNSEVPNSNGKNGRTDAYTPADRPPSREYQNLVEDYHHTTKKERAVQISGTIFSFFASGIEIVLFFIVYIIWERNVPIEIIGRVSGIFVTLMVILFLGIIQLRTVNRWNKNIEQEINHPTLKPNQVANDHVAELIPQKMTQINYARIDQLNKMRNLAIIILFLCLLFFIQFNRSIILSVPVNFLRIYNIYRGLRLLAFFVVIGYVGIELIQSIKWTINLRSMRALEARIVSEIPEIASLERLNND